MSQNITHSLIYSPFGNDNPMTGLGICMCCKQEAILDERLDKRLREKVLLCKDCLKMIEMYENSVEKYSKIISKEQRTQSQSRSKNSPESAPQTERQAPRDNDVDEDEARDSDELSRA
jgi:hypothetical protein